MNAIYCKHGYMAADCRRDEDGNIDHSPRETSDIIDRAKRSTSVEQLDNAFYAAVQLLPAERNAALAVIRAHPLYLPMVLEYWTPTN